MERPFCEEYNMYNVKHKRPILSGYKNWGLSSDFDQPGIDMHVDIKGWHELSIQI